MRGQRTTVSGATPICSGHIAKFRETDIQTRERVPERARSARILPLMRGREGGREEHRRTGLYVECEEMIETRLGLSRSLERDLRCNFFILKKGERERKYLKGFEIINKHRLKYTQCF